jgi:pimeloyl-ACP methyl ester carboxylesterase
MSTTIATDAIEYLTRSDGNRLAYVHTPGDAPGVLFCGGFMSDMNGTKAQALETTCRHMNRAFTRFDYLGHGRSSGEFTAGTIGRWADDATAVLDLFDPEPHVIVGSSMGGWIMLLVALARRERVAGLVGIAAAPDFTEKLMWLGYDKETRETLRRDGMYLEPSIYGEEPYPITLKLIVEGRDHLLLDAPIPVACPVRLLHGMQDPDVPWRHSLALAEALLSADVRTSFIKDGDHRLSRDQDIALICQTVAELCEQIGG